MKQSPLIVITFFRVKQNPKLYFDFFQQQQHQKKSEI